MPVEIRELAIKTSLKSGEGGKTPSKDKGGDKAGEELIAECVEQVLEILRKERER